jgi:hypothetical protein
MKKLFSIAVLVMALAPSSAWADAMFTFDITAPVDGSISYPTLGGPLFGDEISVNTVTGVGTPLNSGVTLPLVEAELNFTTGPFLSSTATTWVFDENTAPGSITMTGGVDGIIPEESLILSGRVSSASVETFLNPDLSPNGIHKLTIGGFLDEKNPALTSFYGMPGGLYVGTFEILYITCCPGVLPPSTFTSSEIKGGVVTNTPIPEPGTLALFGSGLLGIAALIRRKL